MHAGYKFAGVLCLSSWRVSTGMLTWIVGLSRTRNFLAALSRFALLERRSSRRGSVAIQMAIMMTVLIGMAGLGTEVPYMMYKHRQMQTAADLGALGAAVALAQGYPAIATEADGIAAALGFTNGSSNVTVTVNNPPKSGNYTSNSSAVEVIVSQPQTLKMAGLFGVSVYNLSARAVALAGSGSGGGYCMLALDPIGQGWSVSGVGLWGGVRVTMTGCGMAVNASGSAALILQSGGTLTAPLVSIAGQLNNVWSTVNVTSLKQNQPAVSDPYANVAMPGSTGCDYDFLLGQLKPVDAFPWPVLQRPVVWRRVHLDPFAGSLLHQIRAIQHSRRGIHNWDRRYHRAHNYRWRQQLCHFVRNERHQRYTKRPNHGADSGNIVLRRPQRALVQL